MPEIVKSIDVLESMPEFQCGLWYSPYVKIYSIGGHNRIAEISNYPRAYKDTTPHVYTEDTLLIEDGKEVMHYKGDSLPGAFPLWLESEDLPFVSDSKESELHWMLGIPTGKVILTDKLTDKQVIRIKYKRVF